MSGAPVINGTPQSSKIFTQPMSARKAQKLDLGTVERRGQNFMQPEQVKHSRPFGIEEVPTFRPTLEEWRNPMEYMRSIVEEGSKYGIVKVIPPDEWNPDFAIDTEVCLTILLH